MGNYSKRAAYVSKLIIYSDKISIRKSRNIPEKQKPKEKTYKYYIPKNGNLIIVCKLCNYVYKSVENPVCMTIYAQYFKNAGPKVKNPKKDTCAKCDKFKIQLTDNNNSFEQTNKLIEDI